MLKNTQEASNYGKQFTGDKMQKQIADSVERAELLTDVMRGDITLKGPHPEFQEVMIEQSPNLNTRMKAVDLLARMQGDYFVKTEITIGVDYAAELTRLKKLADSIEIDDQCNVGNEEEISFL